MNKDIKQDWVGALKSDEYVQGESELRTKDSHYCCMGVLCDLAVKAGVAQWSYGVEEGWVVIPVNTNMDDVDGRDKGTAILPRFIRQWANIGSANPSLTYDGSMSTLSMLNDSVGLSFEKIADLIQEQM